jgi:peptidoglycan hydrolase-like protein with peptidoglycan-binding domain
VDSVAIVVAVAASAVIVVNAVFLQSGSHPAPFFANMKTSQLTWEVAAESRPKLAEPAAPGRPAVALPAPQPVSVRRSDPIADLIGPSPRVSAVQRALAEFGYGQIKPTGILDDATSAAIEKFEREHKLPATGRISDRLVSGLTAMVGHPLE